MQPLESYSGKFGATPYRVPPADKKVLSFTKLLKFSFTGNTKPAMPAKIFLFVGCYIGGRVHPSKGLWTTTAHCTNMLLNCEKFVQEGASLQLFSLFASKPDRGEGVPLQGGLELHTAHFSFFPREQCTKCNKLEKCQTLKNPNFKKAHYASIGFVRPYHQCKHWICIAAKSAC